jgi:hypothetical protein
LRATNGIYRRPTVSGKKTPSKANCGLTLSKAAALTMKSFIFSHKILPRLARHLAFWIGYFTSTLLTHLPDIRNWAHATRDTFTRALDDAIIYLPLYLLAVYSAIYLLLPIYLKKRKLRLLVFYWFALLAVSIPISYLITEKSYMDQGFDSDTLDIFATALHICMGNLTVLTVAAITIKIMKDYWLRQRENELLAIENIRNKLHLLKMQMHPRILFASLQRIYLEIEQQSREAPEMILKLSELLSYLLYESESDQVPLSKEAQMIDNYLALKRLEYKRKVDIRFETSGELDKHWITPGLFLPLLETGIDRAAALGQMSAVVIELKSIGPKILFRLRNDGRGKDLAKEPAVQMTIRTVKERLRSAGFLGCRLDFVAGQTTVTIVMQLERARSNAGDQLTKTVKT